MPAWSTIALPSVRQAEATAGIRDYLGRGHPYRARRPELRTVTGQDFASTDWEVSFGAARSFACYERPLLSGGSPAVFIELDGRWDLALAAALSRAAGGITLAAESWRTQGWHGLAVFYAGALVQAWTQGRSGRQGLGRPAPPGGDVDWEYRRLLAASLSLDPMTIYTKVWPGETTAIDLVRVEPRPGSEAAGVAATSPLHCALFAFADVEDMALALEGAAAGTAWSVERTPMGVPYGVIVGPAARDEALWRAVQGSLDTYALALSFEEPGTVLWSRAGPRGGVERGLARDGYELVAVLQGFAVLLGACAGELRIPAAPPTSL